MDSLALNGGVVGLKLNFKSTNPYFLGYGNISYVGGRLQSGNGSTSNITVSLTSLTGGTDSSPQAGDIVIIAAQMFNGSDISYRLTNYTQITDLYKSGTLAYTNFQVGYKIMGGTPDSTATITGGSGTISYPYAVAVHVWRNVDTTTPIDVTPTTYTASATMRINPPALTPVTSGAKIIIAGGGGQYSPSNAYYSASYLSNFISQGFAQSNYSSSIGIGGISWTSGSYDPAAWDFSQSDTSYMTYGVVTFALRPISIYGNLQNSGIWNMAITNF